MRSARQPEEETAREDEADEGEATPASPGEEAPASPGAERGEPPAVRRALVLAAGRGRRLDGEEPKPLHEILGLPLLLRTLLTLQRGGVTDVHVVLGHEAERIRRGIEAEDRLELRVHWIHNDRWRGSNGLSVLAAEDRISEPFFLTMSDHVFPVGFLDRLRAHGRAPGRDEGSGLRAVPEDGLRLVIDRDVDAVGDLEDATKVRLEGDRIVDIGKEMDSYEAVDTGVFLATPALFGALRSASDEEGDVSLSEGVSRLAAAGRAAAVDGTGLPWQDVDTLEDAGRAERKLLDSMRKETDGPVARRINRPLSLSLSRHLVRTPVTPNQVSVGAMLVSLLAAGLAAKGGYLPWLAAGVLFQLASVLDGTDGEVAKLTFRDSQRGQWIDTICDNLSYVAFVVGVVAGVARSGLPDLYLRAGGVGIVATLLSLGNIHLYLLREGESGSALDVRYGYEEGDDLPSRLMRIFHYLGKRDVFSFLVLLLAVVGQLPAGLLIFGAGTTLLLLPATLRANLGSWLAERRSDGRRSRPASGSTTGNGRRERRGGREGRSPVRAGRRLSSEE